MNQNEFNEMLKAAIEGGALDDDSFKSQYTGEEIEAYLTKMKNAPTGSTTMDAEVIDIRTGYNGKVHPTAGAAVRSIAAGLCNPNLLDNGVFINGCLVDQRGGYVVPPNTNYFVAGETTPTGVTSGYVKVERFGSSGIPVIKINGTEYICNAGTEVRGYTGTGYTIDRWRQVGDKTITIKDGGLFANTSTDFYQTSEVNLYGKTVTVSLLTNYGLIKATGKFPDERPAELTTVAAVSDSSIGTVVIFAPTPYNSQVTIFAKEGVTLIAVKLELGDQQTLAHLENGKWVLNEIPNYAEELAKCQRYYYVLKSHGTAHWVAVGQAWSNRAVNVILSIPAMRITPTLIIDASDFMLNFGATANSYAVSGMTVSYYTVGTHSIAISVDVAESSLQIGNAYTLKFQKTTGKLALSADL